MKKFLKFINRNKVVFALLFIILICLIIIAVFGFKLLWGETGTNKYGTRLDSIYEITKTDQDSIKLYFLNDENVSTVTSDVQGRILYVKITFKEDYKLSKAKKLVIASLEETSSKVLSDYDIQYTLLTEKEESQYYPFVGYKASSKEEISWINR